MAPRWRRPHCIKLPGGYTIPVVYWSNRKMRAERRKDHSMGDEDLYGYWDGEKVVINESEPSWRQIRTLGHEFVHVAIDYNHWLEQRICEPMEREAGETVIHMADDIEELDK